ncbi:MAG: alpha/beta hydrolase [Alphaproteobacteria bacterium]
MTDNITFSGPSYIPQDEPIERIVFLLHGYGANGDDLIELSEPMSKRIKNTAFYAPNAPFPLEVFEFYMPVGGYQWFTLDGYNPERLKDNPDYLEDLSNKRLEDVKKVFPSLWKYIDEIATKHNVDQSNIVIAGFSQGGFMSLLSSLCKEEKIGGVISFSGVPIGSAAADVIKQDIPVLLIHGDSDDVVPPYALDITERTLKSKNISPEIFISSGVSHTIDNKALETAINFLEKILLSK